MDWVQSIAQITEGRVVSIDGKRLCNSGTGGVKGFIHMVSAWYNANNMVLGQVKTDEKSNEITAIPELLQLLVLEGAVVTIDAMGCQQQIAEQTPDAASYSSMEKSHGRIEKRTCKLITDMDWICKQQNWKNLQSIICIESSRAILSTGETQRETRYYISSLLSKPENFSIIIKIALNLLKNNTYRKLSIKKKCLLCALDNDFPVNTVFKQV